MTAHHASYLTLSNGSLPPHSASTVSAKPGNTSMPNESAPGHRYLHLMLRLWRSTPSRSRSLHSTASHVLH